MRKVGPFEIKVFKYSNLATMDMFFTTKLIQKINTRTPHWQRLTEHPWLLVDIQIKRLKSWIFQATNGQKLQTILIMICKFLYIPYRSEFSSNYHRVSVSTHTQQSQQTKVHCLLEVLVIQVLLQLLATTAQGGANWMTYNPFDIIMVQSLMAIKFMSSEGLEQGES